MADNQTSQDWAQVKAQISTGIASSKAERAEILARMDQVRAELRDFRSSRTSELDAIRITTTRTQQELQNAINTNADPVTITQYQLRLDALKQQQINVQTALARDPAFTQLNNEWIALNEREMVVDSRITQLNIDLQKAAAAEAEAIAAPAGTLGTPPPADPKPGDNTDINIDPPVAQINATNTTLTEPIVTPISLGAVEAPPLFPPVVPPVASAEPLSEVITLQTTDTISNPPIILNDSPLPDIATAQVITQPLPVSDPIVVQTLDQFPLPITTPQVTTPTAIPPAPPEIQQVPGSGVTGSVTPVDTSSNYQGEPIVIGDPQSFTSTATSTNFNEAQSFSRIRAANDARDAYGGSDATQFVQSDLNSTRVVLNNDGTYTATTTVTAVKTAPLESVLDPEAGLIDPVVAPSTDSTTYAPITDADFFDVTTVLSTPPATVDPSIDPASINADDPNVNLFDPEAGLIPSTTSTNPNSNVQGLVTPTQESATYQTADGITKQKDWRVRLSLGPGSGQYLYRAQNPGILGPLRETDGIIFPYIPAINVTYAASYDPAELTHVNYKFPQYRSSSVDSVSISCEFTAQDVREANYLLATIHFLRSVTKMFFGQDAKETNVKNGTPPPLCFLSGMGEFQFNDHPLLITSFGMQLPTEVDYIRTDSTMYMPGQSTAPSKDSRGTSAATSVSRMKGASLRLGAARPEPEFKTSINADERITYIPSRMTIQISALPVVSRYDSSRVFSLTKYADGTLLRGKTKGGTRTGGIW